MTKNPLDMRSATRRTERGYLQLSAGLEHKVVHRSSESTLCIASYVYKCRRLASQSLCCELASVDLYHAPLGKYRAL